MFENLETLSPEKHSKLCFDQNKPYLFARREIMTPVTAGEAPHAARDFVIVFSKERDGLAHAVLGADHDVNAYVGERGHWLCRYVPAHIRRYPFIAGARGTDENGRQQLALMADMDAPHLSYSQGQRLFDEEGQPTDVLKKAQTILASLQRDFERTRQLQNQLDDLGLLIAKPIYVGKARTAIGGLRVIDQDKLNTLSGDDLKALHDSGALMLVHAHLVSLTNLQDGVLAKRAQQTQGAKAPQTQAGAPVESDDTFDFSF